MGTGKVGIQAIHHPCCSEKPEVLTNGIRSSPFLSPSLQWAVKLQQWATGWDPEGWLSLTPWPPTCLPLRGATEAWGAMGWGAA